MSINLNYFKAIQMAMDAASENEVLRREAQENIADSFASSINYVFDAKRNGVVQPVIATTTESLHKCRILAKPGDELCTGDMFEIRGRHWIVTQLQTLNVLQYEAVAWECNYEFALQTHDGTIYHRWGVLDSGVYSTTQKSIEELAVPDKQYRIYLPLDEQTAEIHLDQRIATERMLNAAGEPILSVYRVTGRDSVSASYGNGGHLLTLAVRSDLYNQNTDSYELMLCDYIVTADDEIEEKEYHIEGKPIVRVGGGDRTYTVVDEAGVVASSVVWGLSGDSEVIEKVLCADEDGIFSLSVSDTACIGAVITIEAYRDDALLAQMDVEVVPYV